MKRILAVRHGESEFNVLFESPPVSHEERYHPTMKVLDCNVTELGKQQSREAGKQLVMELSDEKLEYMMISPLRRALQTATCILESFPDEKRPSQLEICKDCAEVMFYACDIGSPPDLLATEYPEWDFSHLETHWWTGGRSQEETWALMQQRKCQETDDQVLKRMHALKKYLRTLSYQNIVIVCHSDVIWWLTSEIKDNGERSGIRPKNGEIVDITNHVI